MGLTMMFKKKIKYPYTVAPDRTILYCPEVQAGYDYGGYLKEKRKYFICSIALFVLSVVLLLIVENDTVQTILSVVAGGFISTIVWFLTVSYKDRIEYQIYTIDKCLSEVEHQIYVFHTPVRVINSADGKVEILDINDPIMMFMHIIHYVGILQASKTVYAEKLKLKNFNMEDLDISNFTVWAMGIIGRKELTKADIQHICEVNRWNYYFIERHLLELKDQLIKYKSYVYSKNPPKVTVPDDRFMNVKGE